MDKHEVRFASACQGKPDGFGTVGTAGHDGRGLAEDQRGLVGETRRHRDHDLIDDTRTSQRGHGTLDQSLTTEKKECLRSAGTQAQTGARGRNHGYCGWH
jgi:hypothetical protein